MQASVHCPNPSCRKAYRIAAAHLGRKGKCSGCGTEFVFVATDVAAVADAASGSEPQPLGSVAISGDKPVSRRSSASVSGRTLPPERLGRFEIRERLGVGGFGAVYRAADPQLQRDVALKLLQLTGDEKRDRQRIDRFLVEGRAGARLQHPHIVPVFDAGRDAATGEYYLAALFIAGQPLSKAIDGQPLAARRAATIVRKLAEALDYSHRQGILHRDVKPDNAMLDAQDEPHLMDFGLARIAESSEQLTRDGAVMGTPSYMSPEQCRGQQEEMTPAADQYSLGCLLYELLTGRTPFDGPSHLQIHHHVHTEPPAPRSLNPAVPADVQTICLKTLAKEPGQRYASCAELAADLNRWLTDEPIRARRVGSFERLRRWCRRNPMVAGLSIGVAALLALVAVISIGATVRLKRLADDERAAKETAEQAEKNAQTAEKTAQDERDRAKASAALARNERDRADAKSTELEWQVYKHLVVRAYQEWTDNRVGTAVRLLDQCTDEHRGWEWRYVKRLCHQELFVFRGHQGDVAAAAFSPDGARVASVSEDGSFRVWDAATGEERFLFKFPMTKQYRLRTNVVAYSPDGKYVAAACEDGVARIWDAKSFAEIRTLRGFATHVACLSFSPDGKRLAVGPAFKGPVVAKVIVVDTGATAFELAGHSLAVADVAFSRDGKRIATAGRDGSIRLWDGATGAFQAASAVHERGVNAVAFTADGKQVVTDRVQVFDSATGLLTSTLTGLLDGATDLVVSRDGQWIATASGAALRRFDLPAGKNPLTFRGHESHVNTVDVSGDGRRLASASRDGTVRIWDAQRDQRHMRWSTGAGDDWTYAVEFSPDGRTIAGGQSIPQLFDVETGSPIRQLSQMTWPKAFGFVRDGSRMVVVGRIPALRLSGTGIWNPRTGAELAIFKDGGIQMSLDAALSPDGRRIATCGADANVRIWELETQALLQTLTGHGDIPYGLAFHPDGRRIASTGDDGLVKVWDSTTGALIREHVGPAIKGLWKLTNTIRRNLAFSPDGRWLVAGGGVQDQHGEIVFWDAETGAEVRRLKGHQDFVGSLVFDPAGARLATIGNDGTLILWEPNDGEEILTLPLPQSVLAVRFSPDGHRIATTGMRNTIDIWDGRPLESPTVDRTAPTTP